VLADPLERTESPTVARTVKPTPRGAGNYFRVSIISPTWGREETDAWETGRALDRQSFHAERFAPTGKNGSQRATGFIRVPVIAHDWFGLGLTTSGKTGAVTNGRGTVIGLALNADVTIMNTASSPTVE
jgi:hypothetical protein